MGALFLNTAQVCERYGGMSSRTIYRWQKQRGFPSPAICHKGAPSLWRISDIANWENNQNTKSEAEGK